MSFILYDDSGYIGDLASNAGLDALASDKGLPGSIKSLIDKGSTPITDTLVQDAKAMKSDDTSVMSTMKNMAELLSRCKGTVTISDGVSSDTEDAQLAEPMEPRRPRGCETFVAFDDMTNKLDTAESKFITTIRDLEKRQISQVVTSVLNKVEVNPTQAIDLPIPFKVDMSNAIEGILLDLFDFGKQQVANELARQRKSIKAADGEAKPVALTPKELLKARAKATANVLSSKLQSAMSYELLRQLRAGTVDRGELETALISLSNMELEQTAKWSVSEALNLGREEEAKSNENDIDRVIYSALMDRGTCDACAAEDTKEFEYPSEEWDAVAPPNPNCEGRDRCRCVGIFVLKAERAGG